MNAFGDILALCKAGDTERAGRMVEAMRCDAEIHFHAGRHDAAFAVMKDLVTSVRRLRNHLRGQALFGEALTWCIQTPLRAGIAALEADDPTGARDLLDKAYFLKTDLAETCRALAACCLKQGDGEAGAAHLANAAHLDDEVREYPHPASKRILFAGDSHARVFHYLACHGMLPPGVAADACVAVGATARGLAKADSISRGREITIEAVRAAGPSATVILFFGGIDTHYLNWRLAEGTGGSAQANLERSIAGYGTLLDWLAEGGYRRVAVAGVHPPTIAHGTATVWGLEALRAPLAVRTAHTLAFNREMARQAGWRGFGYFDISDSVIDPATGVVHARFRVHEEEHHLANAAAAPLWADAVGRYLTESQP